MQALNLLIMQAHGFEWKEDQNDQAPLLDHFQQYFPPI
jgi:hypothetical protein